MVAPIAVTGATGAVGGRVAALLADAGLPMRLVVRDPGRAPRLPNTEVAVGVYGDREAMTTALRGARLMLFVSGAEAENRLEQHRAVVDSAVDAGVRHVVYTSFLGAAADATFTFARDHFHTEEHLKTSGLAYTALRDSLYVDVLPYLPGDDGVIRGPAGTGRFAPVTRDDVAEVAAVVLQTPEAHGDVVYELTGPEALTMHDVAAELGRALGDPISYEEETVEQALASRAKYNAPEWEVTGWVTSYAAIATGEMERVSDDVRRITGRRATSVRDWLAAHAAGTQSRS